MITLRIFLVGLIALVADKEAGKLGVVLLNTEGDHMERHYPLVIHECKNVSNPTERRNCGIKDYDPLVRTGVLAKESIYFGAIVLSRDRIAVKNIQPCCSDSPSAFCTKAELECRVQFAGGRRRSMIAGFAGDVPRNREEAEDFSWVPEMAKVSPDHASFNEDLSDPGSSVVGVLEIEGVNATASTFGFVDLNDMVSSFTFKKLSSQSPLMDYRQALADVVLVSIPLGGGIRDVELQLDDLDLEDPVHRSLNLTASQSDNFIDIVVANVAPLLKGPNCDFGPIADEHFELYYSLSKGDHPVFREAQIPFLGNRKERKKNVEESSPPVLAFVEAPVCNTVAGGGGSLPSSSNRPICTQVVFNQ